MRRDVGALLSFRETQNGQAQKLTKCETSSKVGLAVKGNHVKICHLVTFLSANLLAKNLILSRCVTSMIPQKASDNTRSASSGLATAGSMSGGLEGAWRKNERGRLRLPPPLWKAQRRQGARQEKQ